MKKRKKMAPKPVVLAGEVAGKLRRLALHWGVSPEEAARRVLDQAFVGRGALAVMKAGWVFIEHLIAESPKKPQEETKS